MNAQRLPLSAQPHRAHPRLDRPALHLLRRIQPRRAQALLVADRHRPLLQRNRRLVDGRHRAGPHALAAHARRPADPHESNLPRHRLAHVERLRPDEQRRRLLRPAPGRAQSARLHPHPLRLRGPAARPPPSPGRATSPPHGPPWPSRSPPASAPASPASPTGPWTPAATPCSASSPSSP